MPRFIGSRQPKEFNQTAFSEVYEFQVEPPDGSGYGEAATLVALVPLDTSRESPDVADELTTHIAENLARLYGAHESGDSIELVLREEAFDGSISRFVLPVAAIFAVTQRGPEYIQVGTMDIVKFFDLYRSKRRDFLDLRLLETSDRKCDDTGPPVLVDAA